MSRDRHEHKGAWARVLADSIHEGNRLTTLEAGCWRPNLAEQNTHRALSRNSASTRAIPVAKMLERAEAERYINPIVWPREQKGMQGGSDLEDRDLEEAGYVWGSIQDSVLANIRGYVSAHPEPEHRLHKSLLGRWIEPMLTQTQIISATAWDGYLWQRRDAAAEPHIQAMAICIGNALEDSTPEPMPDDGWHLPLFGPENAGHEHDWEDAARLAAKLNAEDPEADDWQPRSVTDIAKRVSAGRCARVSYLTHDGKRDLAEDIRLYDNLADRSDDPERPPHASPLEHVATPWADNIQDVTLPNGKIMVGLPKVGNFAGWCQLRHLELAF